MSAGRMKMIDALWLIPAVGAGFWVGTGASDRFGAGLSLGVVGSLLAMLWL